eukprot:TRINITY_DN61391_c0_g1_i1.p1 TRINITY_DN61391_c0_g1~~TRINITY_DN61391_c0_g1_i1.p1  ORF type:complete len:789 (-),score=111.59 TRINITY_DN61391_c0_g1_i1:58-2424(-)
MEDFDIEKFEGEWEVLENGFHKLLACIESGEMRPFPNQEFVQLYTIVYNLCTRNKLDLEKENVPKATQLLYDRYSTMLTKYLTDRKDKVTKAVSDTQDFLPTTVRTWNNHKLITTVLQKLFVYLDRYYTKHNNADSLEECGIKGFYSVIYEDIREDIFKAVLREIQRERTGDTVARADIAAAINLFVSMGLGSLTYYENDFQTPFLEATAQFYRQESAKWLAENSATEYMKKAEVRLLEEKARSLHYLHPTSEAKLMPTVEKELLAEHQKVLIEMENSGVVALLRDHKNDDLARMYRLFSRLSKGLDHMAVILKEYSTREGMQIVKKHAEMPELDFKNYVGDMLDIHQKYSKILKEVLENNTVFQKAIKDAFETFINHPITVNTKSSRNAAQQQQPQTPTSTQSPASSQPPPPANRTTILSTQNATVSSSELLSHYCDMLMRNLGEKLSEEEMDYKLDKVVELFVFIHDKDLFQEFYRKQLSKRLLQSNTDDTNERSIISKLKMKCGSGYTSKLEGMINDRNMSEETQRAFKEYAKSVEANPGFEFTAQILTTGFWPVFKIDTLDVPQGVKEMIAVFRDFYNQRTQSRVLKWVHSLGSATLIGNFPKGQRELSMTSYQACLLLMFNDHTGAISGGQMEKQLTLPWEEVKKGLQSLAMGKYKILTRQKREGGGKEIKAEDLFEWNSEFTEKLKKLKIPTVTQRINQKNTAAAVAQVEEDRRHAIEACIVRLMKSRKEMDHTKLISEAIQQLSQHFKPEPRVIKRRIEDLITREYLERDSDRTNVYRYVA